MINFLVRAGFNTQAFSPDLHERHLPVASLSIHGVPVRRLLRRVVLPSPTYADGLVWELLASCATAHRAQNSIYGKVGRSVPLDLIRWAEAPFSFTP